MSQFLDGYIEWRGRDTLLKSQYGILDKESGEHLVPVLNPEDHFDPNDMDIVDSLPNRVPVIPADEPILKPKIEFAETLFLTDADLTAGVITVPVKGMVETFKETEFGDVTVTFNGDHQTALTLAEDPAGEFDQELEIPVADWQRDNFITVFANAKNGSRNGPVASRSLRIADKFTASVPTIEIKTVLGMPYNSQIVYDFTPQRPRFDISGIATVTKRGDRINEVLIECAGISYKATLIQDFDADGYEMVHWTASIPATKISSGVNTFVALTHASRFADSSLANSSGSFNKL